jgi:hypothetical protein
MENLFNWIAGTNPTTPPGDYQAAYRSLLKADWNRTCEHCRVNNINPPWQLEPEDLHQDEARLLAYCADNGGIHWADNSTAVCITTTKGIGLTAIGNAKAVVARCLRLKYITAKFSESVFILDATSLGMEMLEDWEDQREAGIL